MSLDLCLKQLHVVHIKVFHRMQYIRSAADLGMFSMFGRTGAPTKGAVIFACRKMSDRRVKRRVVSKKVASF